MNGIARLSKTTLCRYCRKPIAFIKTEAGKSIPVDPEPIRFLPEDNYEKFVMDDGTVQRGVVVEGDELNAQHFLMKGYRSHFATCPAADDFRRKKNKSERTKEK